MARMRDGLLLPDWLADHLDDAERAELAFVADGGNLREIFALEEYFGVVSE